MYEELHKLDELSRRKFLQYSAKALLGVGLCSVGKRLGLGSESQCQYKECHLCVFAGGHESDRYVRSETRLGAAGAG